MEAVLSGRSPDYKKLVKGIMLEYPKHKICSIVLGTVKSHLLN